MLGSLQTVGMNQEAKNRKVPRNGEVLQNSSG